jgi:cytoskeletal protein RodZ
VHVVKPFLIKAFFNLIIIFSMDNLKYNFALLKETRLSKKITAQSIAADLCLAERQIISIEENSLQYFPSKSLKYTSLKKYIAALGLKNEDVIFNFNEVDPTPSLLKKK